MYISTTYNYTEMRILNLILYNCCSCRNQKKVEHFYVSFFLSDPCLYNTSPNLSELAVKINISIKKLFSTLKPNAIITITYHLIQMCLPSFLFLLKQPSDAKNLAMHWSDLVSFNFQESLLKSKVTERQRVLSNGGSSFCPFSAKFV